MKPVANARSLATRARWTLLALALAFPALAHAQPALLGTWGTPGSGPGEFQHPSGVATDAAGHVFVTDNSPGARVQIFSGLGDFQTQWLLSTPLADAGVDAIAADGAGHLVMLTNSGLSGGTSRYYVRYTTAGTLIESAVLFGPPADCQCSLTAAGVATDAGGDWWIPLYGRLTFNNTRIGQVDRFHAGPGFVGSWGTPGNAPGQIAGPAGIAIAPGGNVYLADATNQRVEEFSSTGAFIRQWGAKGSGDGQFQDAYGIAIGPSGHVYVTDIVLARVQEFTADGAFVSKWGSAGAGLGQFDTPYGIAVDADENIYVADTGNNRIQKFGTPPVPVVRTSWGRVKAAYR